MASVKVERNSFWLCAMPHSAEYSAEFKKKVLSATPRYATRCEIQVKNFLADSMLCSTAGSRLRAIPHSRESRLRAIPYSGESRHHAICRIARSQYILQIYLRIRNHMQKYFNPLISDPRLIDSWKNQGLKISWDSPFKFDIPRSHSIFAPKCTKHPYHLNKKKY
jgi:hypothetical protein